MKMFRNWLVMVFLLAACQPNAPRSFYPTAVPFPTMTLGQVVVGDLPPRGVGDALSNPATAIAVANRPTVTPSYTACPSINPDLTLSATLPQTVTATHELLLQFLNEGGTVEALQDTLVADWQVIPAETGYLRNDTDLTGEGTPELIIGYTGAGDIGVLVVFGCVNGRYVLHLVETADGLEPPRLVWLADVNRDLRAEMVLAIRQCVAADACEFDTRILSWNVSAARFANLLDASVLNLSVPDVRDMDSDGVVELVVRLDSRGTANTGPLRTGVNIYDWDGEVYTLSIIQLDPPRYRIQYVHEADKAFLRLEMPQAVDLYTRALETEGLRLWFNDEQVVLETYILYRRVLAAAYDATLSLQEAVLALQTAYPPLPPESTERQPPFVALAYAFLQAYQANSDLYRACEQVRALIADERGDALRLINRYGSRNPQYTPLDLCPF